MKKKLLSVLLCLTLCLPFVLASCTVPSLWPPKQEKEKTFFDDISCYWDKKEGYDSQNSFVPSGTVAKENDKFVYTTELVYSNESAGILVDKTIYRVYNIASGAIIFEDFTDFDIKTLSYTSESKAISVVLLDKMVMVTKTSNSDWTETAYFYDENGNELLSTTDTELSTVDEDRIILNKKLYVLSNGKLEMKKDLSDASLEFYQMVKHLSFFGDRYVYFDTAALTAYVFDENYGFLYEKALKETQGNTFSEETDRYFTLANGNIIFQTTYSVGEYSAALEPYMYDYISGGKCYKLDTYLLDIRSGSYKTVELPYILRTTSDEGGASLPYGAQNIGIGQKIDGKKLVKTGGSAYTSFLLYNNGTTKGFPNVDGSAEITVIGENRFITQSDFGVKLYDENAKLIGAIGSYVDFNEKFIVTGSAILNHNLEIVYSLTDNNAAYLDLTADSVLVIAYDKEAKASTTYLITTDAEPKSINGYSDILVTDNFFVLTEEKDGGKKIIICKTNGDVIGEYAINENSAMQSCREYDGYTILKPENIEGKPFYITVFKTENL